MSWKEAFEEREVRPLGGEMSLREVYGLCSVAAKAQAGQSSLVDAAGASLTRMVAGQLTT